MKKVYFKKAVSIILLLAVLVMALSSTGTVSARYQYIMAISAGLTLSSIGFAEGDGYVIPSKNNTTTTLTIQLQKKSGNTWVDEGSAWSSTDVDMNTIFAGGQRFVARGTYRALATAKVYSSTGTLLETASVASQESTY